MTREFIEKYCSGCENCIFENNTPIACGEINDLGCISFQLKDLTSCEKRYQNIEHIPVYKVGDKLEDSCGVMKIVAIENEHYLMKQMLDHKLNPVKNSRIVKYKIEDVDYGYYMTYNDVPEVDDEEPVVIAAKTKTSYQNCSEDEKKVFIQGFVEGAQFAKDTIWNDATRTLPEYKHGIYNPIICIDTNGYATIQNNKLMSGTARWCYLNELM